MTDGIIQKVFAPIKTFYEACSNNEYKMAITPQEVLRDLDELQQELISKTKKVEFNNNNLDISFACGIKSFRDYLIGDNKA